MQNRIVLLVFYCGLLTNIFSQSRQSIKIGETIPDLTFSYRLNEEEMQSRLPDNQYALSILDFWATWCSSCVKALTKIDALQQQLGDRVQFIMVNAVNSRDDETKIRKFFDSWQSRYGQPLGLKSVMQDSVFSTLFPHELIPHYVWIDRDGRVVAFTGAEEVTRENIEKVLGGMGSEIKMKKDQSKLRPLFTNDDLPLEQLSTYRILLKGKFFGLSSGNRLHYRGDTLIGRAITNTPLKEIYYTVVKKLYPEITSNRIVTETKDHTVWQQPLEEEARDEWNRRFMYSIELILPPKQSIFLYEEMLKELNRSSGYYGSVTQKNMLSFVLYTTDKKKWPLTKGENKEVLLFSAQHPSLRNASLSYLLTRLNNCPAVAIPVVDETGITSNIDIVFPEGFSNLDSIRKQLQGYGLDIKKAERVMEVFLINEP